MRHIEILAITFLLITLFPIALCSQSHLSTPLTVLDNKQKVKIFSDSIASDIVKDRRANLFRKMESKLRNESNPIIFDEVLSNLYGIYGKPLEYKYKMTAEGTKLYPNGETKPLRKLWYSIKTDKHSFGHCFLFVEVVPDNGSLGSSGFAIVTFPLGVPPELK